MGSTRSVPNVALSNSDEVQHRRDLARRANAIGYEEGVWTPTLDFATTGDLSNAYTTQDGDYWRIGRLLHFAFTLNVTPTFTTASGTADIGGLPYQCLASADQQFFAAQLSAVGITYPGGRTSAIGYIKPGESVIHLAALGSAIAAATFLAADFTSGSTTDNIRVSGFYPIVYRDDV